MRYILASSSPRRREILAHLGLTFTVRSADTDETVNLADPAVLTQTLALRKARAVRALLDAEGTLTGDTVILGADTVVVDPDGNIMGKPATPERAAEMLRTLSGRTHRVVSGVAVLCGDREETAAETTAVTFDTLTPDCIVRYVQSGEPMDKAGAYGIQDTAALWIRGIEGDYFNVVGLPVHCLEALLSTRFSLSLWEERS